LTNHALSFKVFNFEFNVLKNGCRDELGKKWSMKHQGFKSFNEVNNIIFYLRGFANTCKAKEKSKQKLYQYNKQLRKKTKPKVDKTSYTITQQKIMIVNIA
jgi:hypothetical protein